MDHRRHRRHRCLRSRRRGLGHADRVAYRRRCDGWRRYESRSQSAVVGGARRRRVGCPAPGGHQRIGSSAARGVPNRRRQSAVVRHPHLAEARRVASTGGLVTRDSHRISTRSTARCGRGSRRGRGPLRRPRGITRPSPSLSRKPAAGSATSGVVRGPATRCDPRPAAGWRAML